MKPFKDLDIVLGTKEQVWLKAELKAAKAQVKGIEEAIEHKVQQKALEETKWLIEILEKRNEEIELK